MVPDEINQEDQKRPEPDDHDMAAEYVFDDKQAEMIQGKLATDQIDNEDDANQDKVKDDGEAQDHPDDMPMEEEEKNKDMSED